MHFTPFYKKRTYQTFIIGMFVGSLIGYVLLLYMHGKMYEELLMEQVELKTKISELENQNEALLDDKEEMEEQSTAIVTSIQIQFTNDKALKFDRLISLQLEDVIKNELANIIGKSIQSVSESDDLLITVIENKTFTIDDQSYQFEVKKITFSEQIKLSLEGELVD